MRSSHEKPRQSGGADETEIPVLRGEILPPEDLGPLPWWAKPIYPVLKFTAEQPYFVAGLLVFFLFAGIRTWMNANGY